jgi:hypothetical protein
MCMWNRYGIKLIACEVNPNWNCPACEGKCNCAACLRERGIDPSTFVLDVVVPEMDLYSEASVDDIGTHIHIQLLKGDKMTR